MPNQPAKNTSGIYLRVHDDIKAAIQVDIDRLNAERSSDTGAVTLSSWIRTAIEMRLNDVMPKRKK